MDTNNSTMANSTNDSTSNNTIFYYVMPDGSILVYEMTYAQAYLINATQQALKYTNNGLEKLMVFLTSTPFMFLLIGNIQFFSISSLYIFLNTAIPLDVYNTLKSTICALNSNLFTTFNVSLDVPTLSVQKVGDSQALQLGISTQFLASNYEYFILSFGIVIMMSVTAWLLGCFGCWNALRELIVQNRLSVIFGILLSGLPQFTLPFTYELSRPQTHNFKDRLNLSIQLLLIGCIILFFPIFISSVGYAKKSWLINEEQVNKKKIRRKGSFWKLWKQRDRIYIILLNVLFPMLVLVVQPLYFLVINIFLLFFGLNNAIRSKQYRLNKTILNIYPIIFHLCFVVFNFSVRLDITVITQIICLLVYFIGAVHQFLTIIFEFVAFIYHMAKNSQAGNNKIAPICKQTQNKGQVNREDKDRQVWHFTIKPKQSNKTYNFKYKAKIKPVNQHKMKQTKIQFMRSNGEKQQEHTLKLVHWQRTTRNLKSSKSKKVRTIPNISLQLKCQDDNDYRPESILRTYH